MKKITKYTRKAEKRYFRVDKGVQFMLNFLARGSPVNNSAIAHYKAMDRMYPATLIKQDPYRSI